MSVTKEVSIKAEVIDKDALVMQVFVGDATSLSGDKYEMCVHAGQNFPVITLPSGKMVLFDWNALINAAERATEGKSKEPVAQEIADEILSFKKNRYTDYQGLVVQIEEILEDAGFSVDV